ncbi:MAG: hypothetical protein Q9214_004003, partial [Letrouitia sp. 1 TL-2023]
TLSSISLTLDHLPNSLLNAIKTNFKIAFSAIEAVLAVALSATQMLSDLHKNESLEANNNDLYLNKLPVESLVGPRHSDASPFQQPQVISRSFFNSTALGKASVRWTDVSRPKAYSFDNLFAARHQKLLNEIPIPITLIKNDEKQTTISGAPSQERSQASTQSHITLLAKSLSLADEPKSLYQEDEDVATLASPKSLLRVPRSQFPLRVHNAGPPANPLETQRRTMRWRHHTFWYRWVPQVCWLVEPSLETIAKVAKLYIDAIHNATNNLDVEFLKEGGFHKVYLINVRNNSNQTKQRYIFRIASPVDPYYKTECEVATMEFVRHSSHVPVPIVYAYDSSSDNILGFEWIMMEEVKGKPLYDMWDTFNYDVKIRTTKQIAEWATQLSQLTSDQIGGIFMRSTANETEFYIGRSIHWLFRYNNRLSYKFNRGPFSSLADFFEAVLSVARSEIDEIKETIALDPEKYTSDALQDRLWVEQKDPLKIPVQINEEFEEQRRSMYRQADEDDMEDFMNREMVKPQKLEYCPQSIVLRIRRNVNYNQTCPWRHVHGQHFRGQQWLARWFDHWEDVEFGSLLSIPQIPGYLQCLDRPELPSICGLLSEDEDEIAQKLQECPSDHRDYHLRQMDEHWRTKLREVYQEELKLLNSPLVNAACAATENEELYFEQELFNRITEPWENMYSNSAFVDTYVVWESTDSQDN